jgi:hypothetical protein
MTGLPSDRIDQAAMDTAHFEATGCRAVCAQERGLLYALWPTTSAGAQLIYSIALAAAQTATRQERSAGPCRRHAHEPGVN